MQIPVNTNPIDRSICGRTVEQKTFETREVSSTTCGPQVCEWRACCDNSVSRWIAHRLVNSVTVLLLDSASNRSNRIHRLALDQKHIASFWMNVYRRCHVLNGEAPSANRVFSIQTFIDVLSFGSRVSGEHRSLFPKDTLKFTNKPVRRQSCSCDSRCECNLQSICRTLGRFRIWISDRSHAFAFPRSHLQLP